MAFMNLHTAAARWLARMVGDCKHTDTVSSGGKVKDLVGGRGHGACTLAGRLLAPQGVAIVQQNGRLAQPSTCSDASMRRRAHGQEAGGSTDAGSRFRQLQKRTHNRVNGGRGAGHRYHGRSACELCDLPCLPARNCQLGVKRMDRWDSSADKWTANDWATTEATFPAHGRGAAAGLQ